MNVLEVTVGDSIEAGLARFGETLEAAMAGQAPAPYFGVGFRTMAQFGEVFTPKRWELVETLKAAGPLSIYALAKRLQRHYSNVHQDVHALLEWTVIEKDEADRVFVPWDEIAVRWPLVKKAA
jgi:predicted transcriptional regulator